MFDADPIALSVGRSAQRVVSAVLLAVEDDAEADVLSWLKVEDGFAVRWLENEGGNLLGLFGFRSDLEASRVAPAAFGFFIRFVGAFFGADEDVCELSVGDAPGVDDSVGGDLLSKYFSDGLEEAGADDGVVFGKNLQRDVLIDDLLYKLTEFAKAIDVLGIHQDAVCKGAWLIAVCLVRLVEEGAHLGILAKHELVEVRGERFAAGFEEGNGAFDYLGLC